LLSAALGTKPPKEPKRWEPGTTDMQPFFWVDGVIASQTLTTFSKGMRLQNGESWCQETKVPLPPSLTKKSDDQSSTSGPIAASTWSSTKGWWTMASSQVETRWGLM
jgi:hypothetical protein